MISPEKARIAAAAILVLGLGAPGRGDAYEFGYTLGIGVEYSDNPLLLGEALNPQSETNRLISGSVFFSERTRELEARVGAAAAYRDYRHDVLADDVTYDVLADVLWRIAPELFHWTVSDVYTQVVVDPLVADSAANRTNQNVLITGPDLYLRLASRDTLNFGARYTSSDYQESRNTATAASAELEDSVRLRGYARWLHDFSPNLTASLNIERESADYESLDPTRDFDRQDSFIRVDARAGRNTVALDVGRSTISRDSVPDETGDLRRMVWTRSIASDSNFRLTYLDQISDEVTAVERELTPGPLPPAPDLVARTEFYRIKRLDLGYSRRAGFVAVELRAYGSQIEYETTVANNEDSVGGDLVIGFESSATLNTTLTARYRRAKYANIPRTDEEPLLRVNLRYRVGPRISVTASAERRLRTSTDPQQDYTENRAALGLLYTSRSPEGR